MNEIDQEVYDFMDRMERKHKKRWSSTDYPKANVNIPQAMPSYPDKNRGNGLGWEREAKKINSAVSRVAKTHRILNKIATVFTFTFLFLCAVLVIGLAIWNSLN